MLAAKKRPKKTDAKPGPVRNVSRDSLTYLVFSTELGWMGCVWRGDKLDALTFGHPSRDAARAACVNLASTDPVHPATLHVADFGDAAVAALVARLQQFAAGKDDDFLDVKLNLDSATQFQQRVTSLCRKIHSGQVLSYGELAAKAGSPGAARAVGSVMSRNRFPLIVPCHRVIGGGGALGGYSAPEGLAMKRRLLAREGVAVGKS